MTIVFANAIWELHGQPEGTGFGINEVLKALAKRNKDITNVMSHFNQSTTETGLCRHC